MSSDPFLDPSQSPLSPDPQETTGPDLPAHNPERVLALLTLPESPITSALTDFAAGGKGGGLFSGLGAVIPLVLEQATRQLATVPAEQIDQTLLDLAKMLLMARSVDANPSVELHLVFTPADVVLDPDPHHNAD